MRCVTISALVVGSAVGAAGTAGAYPSSYGAQYVQIGASSSSSSDGNATAIRAYLGHEPMPQSFVDDAAGFFWVGVTLPDNTFIQVGTVTHSWGCTSSNYGYFAAFDYRGNWTEWGGNGVGGANTCGATISTYGQFTMFRGNPTTNNQGQTICYWQFRLPTGALTPITIGDPDCDTGTQLPAVYSELSAPDGEYVSTSDTMGPAGAYPALQTQHTVNGSYANTAHAHASYSVGPPVYNTFCPPTNVIGDNKSSYTTQADHAGFGTSLTGYGCTSNGGSLW